jgi:hypothetical protein
VLLIDSGFAPRVARNLEHVYEFVQVIRAQTQRRKRLLCQLPSQLLLAYA